MPPTSVQLTKTTAVNRKRRRPQFRPASQKKSAATKDTSFVTPIAAAATPAISEENVSPAPPDMPLHEQPQEEQESGESSLIVSTAVPAKRSGSKKRKATIGVAIGSSRPDADIELDETVGLSETLVLVEPQLPNAEPGQASLKTFCSRYRTKEKRAQNKAAKANPVQQPQTAPTEQSAASSAGPVVQIVNGEIVLQESSVVVPGARRSVQEVEAEYEQVVEEEAQHSAVIGASYNSFVSRRAPQHWSVVETKKFYQCLRMVGTDFATMAAFFDDRTRKQLKRKYQMENTKNPHLIELSLKPEARIPLDMSVFDVTVDASASTSNTGTTTRMATQAEVENTVSGVASHPELQGGSQTSTAGQTTNMEAGETVLEEEAIQSVEEVQTEEFTTVNEQQQEAETLLAVPTKRKAQPKSKPKAKRPKFRASRGKAKS